MNNESTNAIFELLGLPADYSNTAMTLLVASNSKYFRDLKLNLKTSLKSKELSEKEIALLGLAIASNANNEALIQFFDQKCQAAEATAEEKGEAIACASLLSSNNVFYRFRHFVNKDKYNTIPARLRMNIMRNPVLGKEFFELVSLAVSAVNGCEACVNSHEHSLIELGAKEERIFEAVRLASVLTSVSKVV